MPRIARLDMPELLQHVIVRGVDRCDIFRDDADRRRLLQSLSKLLVATGTDCFAWSLLTSHAHFLLRPRATLLAPFMRRLLTGYAIYFNLRHKRSGHLFQNRYKSFVCEEDAYQLELLRYIHLNPLRAGLVEDLKALDSYPWSGHSVVMGKSLLEGQSADMVLSLFSGNASVARRQYRQFVADGIPLGKREEFGSGRKLTKKLLAEPGEEPYDQRVLGSGEFIEELRMRRELEAELTCPLEIKEIVAKVCRRFEVDPEELLLKSRAAKIVAARSLICYFAVRRIGHSGVEVGRHVNLARAGVSVAAARGAAIVRENQELLALIDK
jgi:putative transposase